MGARSRSGSLRHPTESWRSTYRVTAVRGQGRGRLLARRTRQHACATSAAPWGSSARLLSVTRSGAGVAMQFSYQFPERCEHLVLVSSGGLGPDVGLILRLATLPGSELSPVGDRAGPAAR